MNLGFVNSQDPHAVRRAFQTLQDSLGFGSAPIFTGLTLTGLTASRLIWTNSSKALASKDLVDLVAGTTDEVTVADDGSGGVTIGISDPLIVGKGGTGAATLTDHGVLLGSGTGAITALGAATNGQIPIGSTGADPVIAGITGTANQVTVTNGAGTITLSLTDPISLGQIDLSGDIIPDTDNIYDLGYYQALVEGTIKDYYNTGDDGSTLFGGSVLLGQTFTTTSAYTIASFKAKLYRVTTPGTLTFYLYATAGGLPTGEALATGTYDASGLTTDSGGEWVQLIFDTGYALSNSTQYALVITSATASSIRWLADQSSPTYGGGTTVSYVVTWAITASNDQMFETYSGTTAEQANTFNDLFLSGDISDGTNATSAAEIAAAYTHITSDGTDHTYIDQDVATTASPTFVGLTLSGVTSGILWSNSGVVTGDAPINYLANPDASKIFTMGASVITWNFTNPVGGMTWNWTGGASGHLFSLSQNTGVPSAGTHLLHVDASHANVTLMHGEHGASTSTSFRLDVTGDANPRYTILADGTTSWGNGTDAVDTNLYRSAADSLKTDDTFIANDVSITTPSLIYSLSHDSFADFVSNEHINHTGVTLTAGTGLTGGGDISANRSFAVSADYSVISTNDSNTDVTGAELETLTDGSSTSLHGHYVDRGDPASDDYTVGDFTTDGTWNDLDLSGIVPAGAVFIWCKLGVLDDAANTNIQFRKNGNSNNYAVAPLRTQVANIRNDNTFGIACDTNRVIEYNADNTTWTGIWFTILGWWLG